jgi:DNA-binding transcriptional ArsR family regulator
MAVNERLDAIFAALSDSTRRAILSRLALGEATVVELAEPFDMSQPAISKHLKVLEEAGLVSRIREGARRPARIESRPLADIDAWLEEFRWLWEGKFRQLDALLDQMRGLVAGEAQPADEKAPPPRPGKGKS